MDDANRGLILQKCAKELDTLLVAANIFLWVALCTALAISVLAIVERLAALRKKPAIAEAGGDVNVPSFLDSLKGLVAALAAAPPWYAIFLAGILLLWFSDRFLPSRCDVQTATIKAQPAGNTPPAK
jgi:hypothetical protein